MLVRQHTREIIALATALVERRVLVQGEIDTVMKDAAINASPAAL